MSAKKKPASPKQEEINLRNFLEGQVTMATQTAGACKEQLDQAEAVIVVFQALLADYDKLELGAS